MRHSAEAWSGKTSEVPIFPKQPVWETGDHFSLEFRDVFSG